MKTITLFGLLFGGALLCVSVAASAKETWRPILDRHLTILPGSILDFSKFSGGWRKRPDHLFCASQPFGIEEGFPDHRTADVYARQLRLHGYNLARFHFVENVLMAGRKRDFDFDPEQLDRFHYFLAALKREGIGWILDGLTSWNGAYGDVGPNRWIKKRNVKAGIYFDPNQQAHWKKLIRSILSIRNKYTGMTVLEDPALYGVILVNEGGLNPVVNSRSDPNLDRLFERWLVKRYGSIESAFRAWGIRETLKRSIALPRGIWTAVPRVIDAQRFYYEAQQKAFRWMSQYIRGLGYKGLITGYNNWSDLQDHATRSQLPWVDMHAYHDLPSMFVKPGSRVDQTSSLTWVLEYVRKLANARYWGKPFTVSEYGHPFWNRWRYESGLAVGAYAAFQNWQMICRHGSGPIELAYGQGKSSRRKAIYPFGIGMDPIERANETLVALLYLRGDVEPSRYHLGLRLSEDYVFNRRGGIGKLPDALSKLALVTGVGLVWESIPSGVSLDALVEPGGELPTFSNKLKEKIGFSGRPSFLDILAELNEQGVLNGNPSDGKNLFVSDTGQIILDPPGKTLKVITKRTEAVAFEMAPGRLDVLEVKQSSGPGMVSASSMDGHNLEQSRRILLILATDARNSGMQFADADQKELVTLGKLPVQMRTERVVLRIRHDEPQKLTLYALHLNGERAEQLPLVVEPNAVSFVLDTATLKHGPTTYFELTLNAH